MNPFQLESSSAIDGNSACARPFGVWHELPETDAYDNACQNCGQSAERLTFIPEFEYMGCDECVGEALAVLGAKKFTQVRPWETCSARLALAKECSTVSEFRL